MKKEKGKKRKEEETVRHSYPHIQLDPVETNITPSSIHNGRLSMWTCRLLNPQPSLQMRRQKQSHQL
jgi:hypothetical protein